MKTLAPDLLKRLTYSRYLFDKAQTLQASGTELASADAVLAAHDAAEMLMHVAADHSNVRLSDKFMEFWSLMKAKTGKEPGHKSTMDRLNHMRVGFKHKGNLPSRFAVGDMLPLVLVFLQNACQEFIGIDFSTISLSDLIENNEAREFLKQLEQVAGNDVPGALTFLRQAFDKLTQDAINKSGQILLSPHGWGRSLSARQGEKELAEALEISKLADSLTKVIEVINSVMLGVDPNKLSRFTRTVPFPITTGLRPPKTQYLWKPGTKPTSLTTEEYRFCYNFAIEYALRVMTP